MKSVQTSNFFLFRYSKLQSAGDNCFVCVCVCVCACVCACVRACARTPPLNMFKQLTSFTAWTGFICLRARSK